MKPAIISHHDYRISLKVQMRQFGVCLTRLPESFQTILYKIRTLDLSFVDRTLQKKYSNFGPPPRVPSMMFRSLLVMIYLKVPRLSNWVDMMRTTPVYAILCGFDPEKVPGVSTFYDFMQRLWDDPNPNLSSNFKSLPKRVKKPKGKGKKAISIETETVAELILKLSSVKFDIDEEAFATLFKTFRYCFLDVSIRKGLVDPSDLSIAGDGTPVVTASRYRTHHVCDCVSKGIYNCDCDRFISQPDTNVGWDSSRDRFYAGYDLYLLTDSKNDLPLFPFLNQASRHDSHGFCDTFFRFKTYMPGLKPSALLLDSAHDSMAMYDLCKGLGITPYIDLNLGNTKKTTDYIGVTLGPDGIPICRAGLKMKTNGNDLARQYAKFRCPMMVNGVCTCENPCSDAKYGRTHSIPRKNNIRLYTISPRGSDEFTGMYNKRTSSERCNKRMKNDFLLEDGHHRKTMFWYIRVYLIMMIQHLSAWKLVF